MINLDNVDRPAILAEVTAAFYQYEEALVSNNIEALDALFWHDPRTVRLGAGENLYGIEATPRLSRRPPRRRSGPRPAPYHHHHLWRGHGGMQHRVYPRRQRAPWASAANVGALSLRLADCRRPGQSDGLRGVH